MTDWDMHGFIVNCPRVVPVFRLTKLSKWMEQEGVKENEQFWHNHGSMCRANNGGEQYAVEPASHYEFVGYFDLEDNDDENGWGHKLGKQVK